MTDPRDPDELIEVASAYLDGEATAEEVALVERDPELRQVISALEVNRARVADAPVDIVDPPSRPAHIAAAMSVFDELHAPAAEPAPKVATFEPPRPAPPQDLSAIAAAVTGKPVPDHDETATDDTADQVAAPIDLSAQRRKRRGAPAWLAAAAGTLAVVGGGAYFASQDGMSTADESAAIEPESERVSASSSNGEESAEESFATEMADEDATTEASAADDMAADTAGAAEEETTEESEESSIELLVPPVDPESAYLVEAGTPIEAIVAEFGDEAIDLEFSYCFMNGFIDDLLAEQAPAVAIGMLPVSIGDELYEIILFENDGERFGVARTAACEDPVG